MGKKNKKYPEGHFIGLWMLLGLLFGLPFAFAFGGTQFVGVGFSIGACFGLIMGFVMETKYKKEGKIRPLTNDEKKKRKIAEIVGIVAVIVALAIFLYLVSL